MKLFIATLGFVVLSTVAFAEKPVDPVPPLTICNEAEDLTQCGDVDANGIVCATDALIILNEAVGIDTGVCVAQCFADEGECLP